jgi:hypothetical protein
MEIVDADGKLLLELHEEEQVVMGGVGDELGWSRPSRGAPIGGTRRHH